MALTFKVNTLMLVTKSGAISQISKHPITYKNSRLATAHSRKSCRPKREFHPTTKRLSNSYLRLRTTVKQYGLHMHTNTYIYVNTFSQMAKKALKMLIGTKGLRPFASKMDQYIEKSDSLMQSDLQSDSINVMVKTLTGDNFRMRKILKYSSRIHI
uniref:Uncharacterized protein n=1 Tax=Glossina palpalis gambiensis TaxID=67801 RepID=A0A1B0AR86_9MUSC